MKKETNIMNTAVSSQVSNTLPSPNYAFVSGWEDK